MNSQNTADAFAGGADIQTNVCATPRYRDPLRRDLRALAAANHRDSEIVLLGSIATPKYVEPLVEVLGERLLFPSEFVGRGDMSRGGLMLRCVKSGQQLTYITVATAVRHGARPPSFRHADPLRELKKV